MLLGLCLQTEAQKQNPGYLGKHFSFSYSPHFSLGIHNPVNFWMLHGVQAEYTINERWQLGFGYGYSIFSSTYEENDFGTSGNDEVKGRGSSQQFEIYGRAFANSWGAIAPIGHFLSYGFGVGLDRMVAADSVSPVIPKGTLSYKRTTPYAFLEWGANYMLSNQLMLGYIIRLGSPLSFIVSNSPWRDHMLGYIVRVGIRVGFLAF